MCPTCSHTLHGIGVTNTDGICGLWWCPRCGTLIRKLGIHEPETSEPMLVDRCRKFATTGEFIPSEWRRLGIAESINLPENREPEYEVKP